MEHESDEMLDELAHIFHTPLTGVTAGADLLGRLVPELRAKQGDPLRALIKRNSATLKRRIDAVLSHAAVEGNTVVVRLTADDIKRIYGANAEELEIDVPSGVDSMSDAAAGAPAGVVARPTLTAYPAPRPGIRVLVADDERDLRTLIVTALRDHGYQVTEARDGADALEMIGADRPEILVLDGLMPKVGGFDVCKQAKTLDPAYHPKVVIVTAIYKKKSYQYEAKGLGVDEYLTKPFQVEELLERVARLAGATAASAG
jgi:CheY-like chemotaxis protein